MKIHYLKVVLKRFLVIPFVILALVFSACSKEENISPRKDYTIFGHFYGECFGEECIEIFKIQHESLYEDTNDYYPFADNCYHGEYIMLEEEKFAKVKDLPTLIPHEIYNEENVIGEPDAGDWGGIFLETSINGEVRYWKIDMMKENLPEYLHEFVDTIKYCISQAQ